MGCSYGSRNFFCERSVLANIFDDHLGGAGHLAHSWYETAAAALSSSQSLITHGSGAHETLIRITTAVAAALCILLIARSRTSLTSHSQEELKA